MKSDLKYHYTNDDSLIKILKSKCIWLTHCKSLLDETEGEYVLQSLKKELENFDGIFETMISNFFVSCFCDCGDNSELWDKYGNSNICFDFKAMMNDCHYISDYDFKEMHTTSGLLDGKCSYCNINDDDYKNVLEFIKNELNDIDNSTIDERQRKYLTCHQCFLIKRADFTPENEHRIISFLWQRKPFESVVKGKIKHYVKLHFTPDKVISITISACPDKIKIKNSGSVKLK